jgi:hypothetical protein
MDIQKTIQGECLQTVRNTNCRFQIQSRACPELPMLFLHLTEVHTRRIMDQSANLTPESTYLFETDPQWWAHYCFKSWA